MSCYPNHHIQFNHQDNGFDKGRGYKTSASQIAEQDCQSTVKEWGDIDTFCYEYGFYQDTAPDKLIREPESQIISLGLTQPTLPRSNALQIFEQQYSHYIENGGSSSDGDKEKNEISFTFFLGPSQA
ncbi:hypothetical protein LIER_05686 [Lithospermum erythrorhizon]|uniref:Uncharacterized protein n=1 Tax=Lithospermum erythrorhizon TaxID=34254 RepID=A0AAV3P5I9_LITER